MTALEKKLLALVNGKELPWSKTAALLEKLGAQIIPPTGSGSHFKIIFPGHDTIVVPVHKGAIKKVYAKKIAELLSDITVK